MADPGSCTVTAMPFCYRLHRIMHDPRRRLRTFSLVRLLFATLTSRCYVRYVTNMLMVSGTAAVMKNPLKDRPIQRDVTAGYDVEDEATDAHAASSSMLNLPLPESFAPLSRRSLSSSCTMPPPAVVHRRVKTRCLDVHNILLGHSSVLTIVWCYRAEETKFPNHPVSCATSRTHDLWRPFPSALTPLLQLHVYRGFYFLCA